MRYLIIGVLLIVMGIGSIYLWHYNQKKITIQEVIDILGTSGGTLYLAPGTWVISDKCVIKVVPNKEVSNGRH